MLYHRTLLLMILSDLYGSFLGFGEKVSIRTNSKMSTSPTQVQLTQCAVSLRQLNFLLFNIVLLSLIRSSH